MNWVWLVLIGGILNAFLNYGYKIYGPKLGILYLMAAAYAVATIMFISYGLYTDVKGASILLEGYKPWIIIAMSCGSVVFVTMLFTALARGPISLVDPMWACIYALVSIFIGMYVAYERPESYALGGVALYLVGVWLMAYDSRKKAPSKIDKPREAS